MFPNKKVPARLADVSTFLLRQSESVAARLKKFRNEKKTFADYVSHTEFKTFNFLKESLFLKERVRKLGDCKD